MADKKHYYANGSAAYDLYSNTARPLEQPRELPEEREERASRKKVKVKGKTAIAPFAVIGAAISLVLLVMVLYSYVQLYEASSRVGELNDQLTELRVENGKISSNYESAIDLTMIEHEAKELGMKMPSSNQEVYLNISNTDRGEVIAVESSNIFTQTWGAIKDSFTGIVEYFTK